MLTTVIMLALLMLGGLRGAAASDFHVFGKSIHDDETLQSSSSDRILLRKQPRQQMTSGIRRSLDLESFKLHVTPATSKISLPTIIKLYPPTAKPLHMHANMPLRFGRDSSDDRAPNSSPNMPQRFGRSWELLQMCGECRDVREAPSPVLPQRFGRNVPYWSLLRTLASEHLLNTGLSWVEDLGFKRSSEEDEMEEKTFKE
ncbi:pro-FMRFamide-related neuropeptide VF [Austrofundulus limnaeus]|uniref:Pro-FMRFamide-related neuropeptide VF n=1 Tax=Austrofundulus limnaeus TaxID=52670 RepID=A0A2I4BFW7_AUSLI|nr:PREDICTED: pro-FMRFamide-related neuropeptide VF [Austrofundulus limnaeus]